MSYYLPGYDNWKLAGPFDNAPESDDYDVTRTFRLTESDGTIYNFCLTRTMSEDRAADMGDLLSVLEEFSDDILAQYIIEDDSKLEVIW